MKSRLIVPVLLAALAVIPFGTTAAPPAAPKPEAVASFTLTDVEGKAWKLHDQKAKATVVAFLAAECPMSQGYIPVLAELSAKYLEKGVTLVGVFPDAELTAKQLTAHVNEFKIPFPVFRADHEVATTLGAKVTPEVVVLDAAFAVRYRGRIDDLYTARAKQKPSVTRADLAIALDELLAGKDVSVPETKAFGCPIPVPTKKPASDSQVTFYKDVLPVFAAHCQQCHRPGQVAPFALTSFKEATKWGDLCLEEVKAKRMPPWKPAPNALLAGDRTLPPEAVAVLKKWVDQGMPEGDPKTAPAVTKFTDDWAFGEPDLILEAPGDMTLAASGPDHFRVIVFPTNLPEDKHIVAMEVRPGNPRVVHHTVQLIDTIGVARKLQKEADAAAKPDDADRGPGFPVSMGFGFLPDPAGFLGGWAPGMLPKKLPDGVGQRLPKGGDLCVQFHYHRTGKVETDRTKVGLYFAKKPVTSPFISIPVAGLFWSIPAGAKDYKVDTSWRLQDDVTVYRFIPHMHLIGKDIELIATAPGGKPETLIRIPAWDFNWQEQYELKEPRKLAKGTVLRVRGTYDNSANNPNNPSSPPKSVKLGEQTTNEMCFVFLGISSSAPPLGLLTPIFGK